MKIRSFVLAGFFTSALSLPVFSQTSCEILLPSGAHEEILKEILNRSVTDAKEFERATFFSDAKSAQTIDLTVKKDKTTGSYAVSPREKFTGEFPATWLSVERLNNQLTAEVLNHLANLQKEKKRSAQDIADIFMGSLNWKRLEEQKPPNIAPEPKTFEKSSSAPSLQIWKLLRVQLALIFGPMIVGLLFGLPFGKSFYKNEWTKNFFTSLTSIFLTIPPIALLCFFIPSYGMGRSATVVTLILLNILLVMKYSSDGTNIKSALFISQLKKLAILNVNLSTLAAFLGVGGLGSLISLGLALNDIPLTLRGTLAVAFLAMSIKWIFEGLEYVAAKREERV